MDLEELLRSRAYSADLRSISDTAGFILVYPQGLPSDDGSSHWNIAEIGGNTKVTR